MPNHQGERGCNRSRPLSRDHFERFPGSDSLCIRNGTIGKNLQPRKYLALHFLMMYDRLNSPKNAPRTVYLWVFSKSSYSPVQWVFDFPSLLWERVSQDISERWGEGLLCSFSEPTTNSKEAVMRNSTPRPIGSMF